MQGVKQLLERLTLRRLTLRTKQIAALATDQLATVYPRPIEFEGAPKRVLVLTPHADDETFGAGGSLLRHHEHGDSIRVLLFSDNVASIDGKNSSPEERRSIREAEFEAAMRFLPGATTTPLRLSRDAFVERACVPGALKKELI